MRKHLRFAFAAAVAALSMIVWARAGNFAPSSHDIVRPKVEMASPALDPNLPFQVLRPVY
jgi:hypothetical protein